MERLIEKIGQRASVVVPFLEATVGTLPLPVNSNVLDVGTGNGMMAAVLAARGYLVTTGEPEGDNWADWRANVAVAGLLDKIHFQPFRAEQMPFALASFDAVFLYGSFHHVQDPARTLQECARCCKPSGIICIVEPNEKGIAMIRQGQPAHPDSLDPRHYLGNLALSCDHRPGDMFDAYIFTFNNKAILP